MITLRYCAKKQIQDVNQKHQGFVYTEEDQAFRLKTDTSYYLAVTSETQKAGSWVKRPLQLIQCDEAEQSLMKWTVVSE